MPTQAGSIITQTRSALALRAFLNLVVSAGLWSTSLLFCVVVTARAGYVSDAWGWAALAVFMIRFGLGLPQTRISRAHAGAYLDRMLHLKERMLSVATLQTGRSRFAELLLYDAEKAIEGVRTDSLFGGKIPEKAPYLALPVAGLVAAVALIDPAPKVSENVVHAEPVQAPMLSPRPDQKAITQARQKIESLMREIEKAQSAGDKATEKRLLERLQREIQDAQKMTSAVSALPDGGTGTGTGSGEAAAGVSADWIALNKTLEKATILIRDLPAGKYRSEQQPDWETYRQLEGQIPFSRRDGVRSYMTDLSKSMNSVQ